MSVGKGTWVCSSLAPSLCDFLVMYMHWCSWLPRQNGNPDIIFLLPLMFNITSPEQTALLPKSLLFYFFFYTALWGYIYPVHIQDNLGTILRLSTLQFFAHSPAWLWLVQISNLLHEVHAYFEGEPMLRVIYKALQFC